jgi:hypothetical protein
VECLGILLLPASFCQKWKGTKAVRDVDFRNTLVFCYTKAGNMERLLVQFASILGVREQKDQIERNLSRNRQDRLH